MFELLGFCPNLQRWYPCRAGILQRVYQGKGKGKRREDKASEGLIEKWDRGTEKVRRGIGLEDCVHKDWDWEDRSKIVRGPRRKTLINCQTFRVNFGGQNPASRRRANYQRNSWRITWRRKNPWCRGGKYNGNIWNRERTWGNPWGKNGKA